MIRIKNSEFIKVFEDDVTIKKIGKIDLEAIKDDSFYNTKINKTLLDEHSCWDSLDIIVKTYE